VNDTDTPELRDRGIVNVAPAVRFTERLKGLIESSYTLQSSAVESQLAAVAGKVRKVRR
jgi:hypothetical protein